MSNVETCSNGHDRAEYWNPASKRCRKCASEASQRSRAKHRPVAPAVIDREVHALLESLFRSSKKGSAELREPAAWLEQHRPEPVEEEAAAPGE